MTTLLKLLLFCLFISRALASDVALQASWKVSVDKNPKPYLLKNLSQRDFLNELDHTTPLLVEYDGDFVLDEENIKQKLSMILPATWLPIKVFLNGADITTNELTSPVKNKIYQLNKIDIPVSLLQETNKIKVTMVGIPILQGFRGGDFKLINSLSTDYETELRDFFINSIHSTIFLSSSLLIGLFSLFLIKLLGSIQLRHLSLAVASLCIIPYHLLTSNFYGFFFTNPESPFKFQIIFQSISWIGWGYFLISSTGGRLYEGVLKKKWFILGLSIYYVLIVLVANFISFHTLSNLITPALLIPLIVGPYSLINQRRHQKFSFLVEVSAVFFGYLSFIGHLLQGNLYFLGYSTFLFMAVGFYDIIIDFSKSSKRDRSAGQLLSNLLPIPVFSTVSDLLDKGAQSNEIRIALRGDGILTTIFVDICSYGEMSLRLPSKIVYLSRIEVFEFLKKISEKNNHSFIKSIGDSVHFAAGFSNVSESKLNQSALATSCLLTVKEILDSIDEMNLMLKEKDLPAVKLKISATIGHGEFGLEGTSEQVRFDILGHWVNVTKRFEEAMNEDFYKKHGHNVALVSSNLFNNCDDLTLRKRFMEELIIIDKHGGRYSAYIGAQYGDNITKEDYLKAVYGQFSHGNNKRDAS